MAHGVTGPRPSRALLLALGGAALLLACSSRSGGTSSDGMGLLPTGGPAAGEGSACATKQADAIPGSRPVDIIFAIDNSVSMAAKIAEVERQINDNFASIIEASKTDYRVIMLSAHGAHGTDDPLQKICVKAPLSGTSCSPIPKKPAETQRFFQHDIVINSTNSLCQILETYRAPDKHGLHPHGWAELLRPKAFKVFAVITDDQVSTMPCGGWPKFDDRKVDPTAAKTLAQTFETALFALDPAQFGTSDRRNFMWHSIVGVAPFDPADPTKPYPPTAPVNAETCTPGAEAPGVGYQALSQLTGGLRYPTCGLDYTTIFKAMASGVVDDAVLSCDYSMPADPPDGKIDPDTTIVRYTSGETVTDFTKADDASACAPGKFYLEAGHIKLCPDACTTVQSDSAAQVKILFGCYAKAN